jgi:ABC transport system ATP-binding/permease protein
VTQLVVESDGVSQVLDPGRSYRIGRDPKADIVLGVSLVSRSHAVLRFESGQWILEDTGSANGTYDGRRRVERVVVQPGSEIRLGHADDGALIRFQADPAAAAPPAPAPPAQQPADRPGAVSGTQPPYPPQGPGYPPQDRPQDRPQPGRHSGQQAPPAYQAQPPYPSQPNPQYPPQQGPGYPPQGYPQQPPYPPQGYPQQQPPGGQYPGRAPQQPYRQQQPPYPGAPGAPGYPPGQPPHPGAPPQQYPGGPASGGQRRAGNLAAYQQAYGRAPQAQSVKTMIGEGKRPQTVLSLSQGKVLKIGRAPENDVVVNDLLVSRFHAELHFNGGVAEIIDLGGRNGTYLNGQLVERARMGPEDIVGIGTSTFHLVDNVLMEFVDTGAVSLYVHQLAVTVDGGRKTLLDHVSFPVGEKCLLAVIGPSGAGKSTLLKALTGLNPANQGTVYYDGRDLYRDYSELRSRIGLVPQEDILHTQLTVRRALVYAAELRFPDDTRQHERKARVDEVLVELGLDHRRDVKISSLSGGQRKRVSVALELLTKPSLLFLDEPTSGLDPGLDKSVMQMLRGLADDGRTVMVVTHSVANLDQCDRLLVLAPGGKIAFYGPPKEALPFLGFTDWADVFQAFDDPARDWAGHYGRSVEHQKYVETGMIEPIAQSGPVNLTAPPKPQSWPEQLSTLVRRYCRSIAADPLFLGITIALPIIMGLLAKAVPTGNLMSTHPGHDGNSANLLLILCIGGCLTGAANAVRELVKERPIYQRERAVGLSRSAYLASKLLVLGLITAAQGVALTIVALLGVQTHSKGVFTSPMVEVILAVAMLSITAMVLGLFISAVVKTSEMTMPLLVLFTLVQVVFCGALVHLHNKPVLEQIAWLVPARWAFAAMAGSLNVAFLTPGNPADADPLWKPQFHIWALDMSMMLVLSIVLAFAVSRMLRRHEPQVMRK